MLRLEDVIYLNTLNSEDQKYLEMITANACKQVGLPEDAVQVNYRRTGFLNLEGKLVDFEISSSYKNIDKAGKVVLRVFKRLYNSRGREHDIHVMLPNEKKMMSFELLLADWDRHKLKQDK